MTAMPRIKPLYRCLLGEAFETLPPLVRALHDLERRAIWTGRADVERGHSRICRMIASITGLPPTGTDQPLTVTFTPDNGAEIWHRAFGAAVFRSRQSLGDGAILEAVGPARLTLVPAIVDGCLTLTLTGVRVLGFPLPRALLPVVATREYEVDGRYRFEVEARMPWFGRLVRYTGWLGASG